MKLTDPNPYEILEIQPDVDKDLIAKAFARKNRGSSQERHFARTAYDTLRNSAERLLVDALHPNNQAPSQDPNFNTFLENIESEEDWSKFLPDPKYYRQDLQNLVEAAIRTLYQEVPPPDQCLILQCDFDMIDDFLSKNS